MQGELGLPVDRRGGDHQADEDGELHHDQHVPYGRRARRCAQRPLQRRRRPESRQHERWIEAREAPGDGHRRQNGAS